ncbi:hypothetical protein CBR_g38807 [Chara braunii]|uniref:DDE Tnp4 domain-containing protein n=1 Tax=Chara braunii TaxID=69332 RepID=A0A388LQK2_CHABU|nr:hypothetical protein CBR_g38807 [Chara braunii]|eukprot:GBG84525.1 hypothetical protein CBR_g38807 [Chara braunii]
MVETFGELETFDSGTFSFEIDRATGITVVWDVTDAIFLVYPNKIAMPTGRRQRQVPSAFAAKGFPNCFGAIDNTHVFVDKPENAPSEEYCNRKSSYSVVAPVVVDLEQRVFDVFIGYPDSVHDARVLWNLSLFKRAGAGTLFDVEPIVLPGGVSTKGYLLGDKRYDPKIWMVVPYGGVEQQSDVAIFDGNQNAPRGVVERAFGRLKGMWRLFLHHHKTNMENMPQQFHSVCILHNLLVEMGIDFNERVLLERDADGNKQMVNLGMYPPAALVRQRQADPAALALRDALRARMAIIPS